MKEKDSENFEERVVHISRVAKVVKGGRRFSFSALVVVGDRQRRIGFGVGKAGEVPDAIRKGADQARKKLMQVKHVNGTLPFEVDGQFGSSQVRMYPAKKGKGIIAGGAARIIAELSGLEDVVCKIHGSKNHYNVVRATVDGLGQLYTAEEYSAIRDKSIEEVIDMRHEPKVKKAKE